MIQDEIIAMAKEAGIWIPMGSEKTDAVDSFERFAALVEAKAAAKEREACAQVAAPPKDSAEFALAALVAAGHVSQSKVDYARALMPEGGYVPKAVPEWLPIATAPKDGTYILLGSADGSWIARNYPVYQSGYRPDNPWQSMMLNHEHMGRYPKAKPTHWMPLPAAPKP